MNFRKTRRESLELNLIPLIDVVFMLLIFFMITTTFREESQIQVDLPQASEAPHEPTGQPIEIVIDREGRFYVDKQLVINTQLDTLKRALRQARGNRDNPAVLVSADAQTPHQAVITAMDAARQVGLLRMSIATRQFETSQ